MPSQQFLETNCALTGAKSLILRVQADGKRRDIGLVAADLNGSGREAFRVRDERLGALKVDAIGSAEVIGARDPIGPAAPITGT